MSFLVALGAKFWPYIVGGLGLVFAAFKIRQSGAKAERAKQAAKEAAARTIADEVENDVGALPGSKAREELGKWSK
jgi:hypothetical protein